MTLIQILRGMLTMLIAPFATLFVSILSLLDINLLRRSEEKVQIFPRRWGQLMCWLPGVRVRIEGLELIDSNTTYIFAANHCSQYDIFAFQGYFPHNFRWIAKKELFRIPFFGSAMHRIGYVSIDRSQGREAMKSLDRAAQRIAQGTSVLIFPEGTRSSDGRLQNFKGGTALLAIKAKVPIVPLAFNGSYEILAKGKFLPNKGEICLRIGKPIPTEHYKNTDKQKLAASLQTSIEALLEERYHQKKEEKNTPMVKE